jgi:nucleoside-diphosphate-sugar epimerase
MAEILITGGAGNFGRTVAQPLQAAGHSLRLLDLPVCDFSFCNGWQNTRVIPGDILDLSCMKEAAAGVDWVLHLAAILPPFSEEDKDRTFRVNVDGTRVLMEACQAADAAPQIAFASSISVYGDTSGEEGLIDARHPVNPNDWYAESKVAAEKVLEESGVPFANLRISGIVIPAFLDPPEPWSFQADQKIELITLSDVVTSMLNLVNIRETVNKTLVIAGGRDWQIRGADYVRRWAEIMEIPFDEMMFMERPGWLNWYDTDESQALLDYQKTPRDDFFSQLSVAVEEALM